MKSIRPRIRVATLIRQGERLLFVQHKRKEAFNWLLPGGGVEYGESLTQALEREIQEETGLNIRVGRLAFICETLSPDGRYHILHPVFWSSIQSGELELPADEKNITALRYFNSEEMASLVIHPPIHSVLETLFSSSEELELGYQGTFWTE